MKIQKIRIKNFLSFGDNGITLNPSDHNIIVGPNGAGKTNLFRAIAFVGDALAKSNIGPSYEFYYAGCRILRLR